MDFSFKVNSIRSGWIELDFLFSDSHFILNVSNRSDPLDEFLDILIKLHDFFSEPPLVDDNGFCLYLFWEGEKSQYTLTFTPDHERKSVLLDISYCENTNAGIYIKNEKKIYSEVPFNELARKTYDEFLSVLREYGFYGYRREWIKSCFPVCYLLCLHKIVIGETGKPSNFIAELASLNEICKTNEKI